MLSIEISDTGIGIPDEEMEAIFEDYHQVDNVAHERGRGLGLGLSIVKHFVTGMGGRVWCETPESRGAQFIVELPLLAPAQPPKA